MKGIEPATSRLSGDRCSQQARRCTYSKQSSKQMLMYLAFECDFDVVLDVNASDVHTVMFDDAGSDAFAVHAAVVDAAVADNEVVDAPADVSISLIKR